MPITSLPSPYGVGTMGKKAGQFIDFLKKAGQTYWQILPICPTGYGDSPYQSFSTYAGNPYMIDLDELEAEGFLHKNEFENIKWYEEEDKVDYAILFENRLRVLKLACSRIDKVLGKEYEQFCLENAFWVNDYALYMTIKGENDGRALQSWSDELRMRDEKALKCFEGANKIEIENWKKIQFLFFRQWKKLKGYAEEKGIKIIGDLPIYVSSDSADAWANPEVFQFDENMIPKAVAGCPPDTFSADGQLWGNPLYDWEYLKKHNYEWWIRRVEYQFKIYDLVRIDHFRGFDEYFSIPYGESSAKNGCWKEGPGIALFDAIKASLGDLPIIAEDLGFVTPTVRKLLEDTGYPGMKILEFSFDERDTGARDLPHSYKRNCVAYTGTHDNETVMGWFETAPKEFLESAIKYLRLTEEEGYNWGMIKCLWASTADTVIVQMQDFLGLGHEGRINTPSTLGQNWVWRCHEGDYNDDLAVEIKDYMRIYER